MGARGTRFTETLVGQIRFAGEDRARPVRLRLEAVTDGFLRLHATSQAQVAGRVSIDGMGQAVSASGALEISPLARRRIRYTLAFSVQGREYLLEGWKSVSLRRPVTSMTTLPFVVFLAGERAGWGELRFRLRTLPAFLGSFRFPRRDLDQQASRLAAPRWNGSPGRTEVWYTTVTDPATGTGVWLHHELVAPTDGSPAQVFGWIAVFPPDGAVRHARFGPEPWCHSPDGFATTAVAASPGALTGSAGDFRWDLAEVPLQSPLFTFPRWSWHRELLPAVQLLPAARSAFSGAVACGDQVLRLVAAPGASARIYGHGYAQHWSWLHADLGPDGVLEIVAAVSNQPPLNRLPPLVFLRLRRGRRTWPRLPLRPALGWAGLGRFRADISFPHWTVQGTAGLRRIRVEVTQRPDRTLTLDYHGPSGETRVCRNTEAADAVITLERWRGRWRPEAQWELNGTAHAEVGGR